MLNYTIRFGTLLSSAWVRFCITKIDIRLCTRTEIHKVTETHMTPAYVDAKVHLTVYILNRKLF